MSSKKVKDFSVKWNPLAIKARELDKKTSIHNEMKPTKDHKKLHENAVKFHAKKIQKIELEAEVLTKTYAD